MAHCAHLVHGRELDVVRLYEVYVADLQPPQALFDAGLQGNQQVSPVINTAAAGPSALTPAACYARSETDPQAALACSPCIYRGGGEHGSRKGI